MLRKVSKGLGILLVLAALALAYVLVPAHLQIREISPDLPTKADLEKLKGSADGPVKLSFISTSTHRAGDIFLGHNSFVVEWADGKILLVDLGMDRKVAVEFGKLFETVLGGDPAISQGTLPELMGDDLQRVKGVAFTHLHQDHVQGIEPICASGVRKIIGVQTSDQMTKHNYNTVDQIEMLRNSSCVEQRALAENSNIPKSFPGVGIYPLGGHTPGSTLFAIPIGDTLWLLSGDISNSRDDLLENRGKGFIYSYLLVPEDEARLGKLRIWLTDLDKDPGINVIVSHDAAALIESGMDEWKTTEPAE